MSDLHTLKVDVTPDSDAPETDPPFLSGSASPAALELTSHTSTALTRSATENHPERSDHALPQAHRKARKPDRETIESQNAIYKQELLARNRRLAELVDLSHALVDNVSHEFRTPLAVLKEFIALFLDGLTGELNDTQREYLHIMAAKVNDLTLMVNDLLDTSRIDAGLLGAARTPGSVETIFDAVRPALMQRAAVQHVLLAIECPPDLPPVYVDMEKAGRALTNLAINAIKYSPEGKTVHVQADRDCDDPGMVRIRVTDCGPGIAPENLDIIFDRFQQVGNSGLAAQGFGLGLSIVKELVQLNLGDVHVTSRPEQGSAFSFTLPIYDPPRLLARYIDRLVALKCESCGIALLEVQIRHDQPAVRDTAADYVNRSLRPFDLFLPTPSPDRWLIVASTPSHDQVLNRLRQNMKNAYRGLPSRNVPRVSFTCLGIYQLGHDARDDIINRCLDALEFRVKE